MSEGATNSVVVIGAGGHAKVVISTLQEMGKRVEALYDDDRTKWGKTILGVLVVGSIDSLPDSGSSRAIIAIGDNATRIRIASLFSRISWIIAVHPHAYVHPSAQLGCGTLVCAGAVIQPDTVVGRHVIVNTAATIDHDCSVGDGAHLGPGAHVAGGVSLGQQVFLGVGSSIMPSIVVGDRTVVGSGATVVNSLPADVTAVGVPAKPIR